MDPSSYITIIGWFAQVIFDKLLSSKLLTWAAESGLGDNLEKLRIAMLSIQSLLANANRMQLENRSLTELLKEVNDIVYAAEDIVDEIEYEALEREVEIRNNQVSDSNSHLDAVKDVVTQASGYLSAQLTDVMCLVSGNQARDYENCSSSRNQDQPTPDRINKIIHRLDRISACVREAITLEKLDNNPGSQHVFRKRRVSTSTTNEPEVLGREEETEKIIKMLLQPGDEPRSNMKNITVVPIVGIGGVGKTTLAQVVYNDRRVEQNFQLRMWVCISDSFDEKRLTREIIESACRGRPHDLLYGLHHITNFDTLQGILREILIGNKFLLVLDDVWTEEWEILCASLKFGNKGSKILLTSRDDKVVNKIGKTSKIVLGGLEGDSYWTFFKRCAFGDENPDDHPKLQWLGKQIANKLKGSPLAAKTVGGLLNTSLNDRYWTSILKNDIWKLPQGKDDIMPVLKLSYLHLPPHLQRCFAYCSVFPKTYEYSEEKLIHIWIAQGFIPQNRQERIEDIGKEYFTDLLCRSFFQLKFKGKYYVMHDLLHDLAQSVSSEECFRIEGDEPVNVPQTVRHLSMMTNNLVELQKVVDFRNLRTLILVGGCESNVDPVLQDVFSKLKCIRVLDLTSFSMTKLPHDIGNLRHLRCLFLSASYIKSLPGSLCRLYHLQVLNIALGCQLDSLPELIGNLINLRHLIADSETVSRTAGIGKLTSLQILKEFHVMKERGHEITQLKEMTELQGSLSILSLQNVDSRGEASKANLTDKRHLHELMLGWDAGRNVHPQRELEVLEGLKPHPNLRHLRISGYGGERSPVWMENLWLQNLEYVCLTTCNAWEDLPPLGHLPFLKVLEMKGMLAVRQVGHRFYGSSKIKGFPSLEELGLYNMPEWEEWCETENGQSFPRLQRLVIRDCPKLQGLPPLPPRLKDLHMERVGLATLPTLSRRWNGSVGNNNNAVSPSLSTLFIEDCPRLQTLGEGLLQQHLTALEKLTISFCDELVSLPEHGFRPLVSLKELMMEDCPKLLTSMMPEGEEEDGNGLLPSSLEQLEISSCGDQGESLSQCLRNLSSLTKLRIIRCANITSLPSPEVLGCLKQLQHLTIRNCEELISLGGLTALVSLRSLCIHGCPKLTICSPADSGTDHLLPSSIEYLNVGWREDLDRSLPRCLQNLTSLSVLEMCGCPHITLIPEEVLLTLTALQHLTIRFCKELTSLEGFQFLHSLRSLHIQECPSLTLTTPCSPVEGRNVLLSLDAISIDNTLLLTEQLLKEGLTSLRVMEIFNSTQITTFNMEQEEMFPHLKSLQQLSFINCTMLESLPGQLQLLCSLERLWIQNCPMIQSLPERGLPLSLKELRIWGCDQELKNRCQKENGVDWEKIVHIHCISIDGEDIQDLLIGE